MQHFGFIFASYLSTCLILGVVALWLMLDHKKQKAALQALEARGVRRRSSTASKSAAVTDTNKQVIE